MDSKNRKAIRMRLMQIKKMEHQKEKKQPQWIEKVLMLTKKMKGRPRKRSPLTKTTNENNMGST